MNLISYILAGLVAILTINQICWDYLIKYIFKDGRTNEHKKFRRLLLVITLALFALNFVANNLTSYQKDQQAQKDKKELHGQIVQLSNQLATITIDNSNLAIRVSVLTGAISTNTAISPVIRLAVLNDELERNSDERNVLQKSHELFDNSTNDLKALSSELNANLALRENQKRQEILQQQIDDIQKQKDVEEAAKQAQQLADNQRWVDEQLTKLKPSLSDQILPTFDYEIRELDKLLAVISKETGQIRHSDFLGETPTVYMSAMVDSGVVDNGTNTIGIGTSSAWNFKVSTSVARLSANPRFNPNLPRFSGARISITFPLNYYAALNISSMMTNGESNLSIQPYMPSSSDALYQYDPGPDTRFYNQISIKLNVPNGLNIDELEPAESCKQEIDRALRQLIEAQIQQYPLVPKGSN